MISNGMANRKQMIALNMNKFLEFMFILFGII